MSQLEIVKLTYTFLLVFSLVINAFSLLVLFRVRRMYKAARDNLDVSAKILFDSLTSKKGDE